MVLFWLSRWPCHVLASPNWGRSGLKEIQFSIKYIFLVSKWSGYSLIFLGKVKYLADMGWLKQIILTTIRSHKRRDSKNNLFWIFICICVLYIRTHDTRVWGAFGRVICMWHCKRKAFFRLLGGYQCCRSVSRGEFSRYFGECGLRGHQIPEIRRRCR